MKLEVLPIVPRPRMNYDRIDSIVNKYNNQPSIAKIKEEYGFIPYFSFHEVSVIDIKTITKELESNKASSSDIPTKVSKQCD